MKIFVVTADVELTKKPVWLDDFRAQYDKPYQYHLTLKQPCFVDEAEIADIKKTLNNLFSNNDQANPLTINFDTLNISKDAPGGICIMIKSSDTKQIKQLQKLVASALSEYQSYYKPQYEIYEKNFEPHITIGRDLDETSFNTASKQLTQNYECAGKVSKIILTVVNNFGPEEANDLRNQTVYTLKNYYMNITQGKFEQLILLAGSKATSADPEHWTEDNPLWGHCAIVSLLAQELFGGELLKGSLKHIPEYAYLKSHIWNRLPDGKEKDFTAVQYNHHLPTVEYEVRDRSNILSYPDTQKRYALFTDRFSKLLN